MRRIYTYFSLFLLAVILVLPTNVFAGEGLFYFFNNTYGLANFKKNYKDIDVIAPQVYTVGYDLKVKKPKSSTTKIIRAAKDKGSNTIPLIVNANFDKVLMSDILLSEKAQDEIIQFMIDEAKKNKFTGWQFDFENINHLDRDMYSAFVAKTYKKMKENNLSFSVAVIPRSTPYDATSENQDWSSGYDFKSIAKNTDFVSLMSYDDPASVGPVASLPYTKKILDYMKTQIPAEKISLGIPLYCWKWSDVLDSRVGSLTNKLALAEYGKGKDKKKGYDEDLGAQWYSYSLKGSKYTTWCEGEESMQAKLDLIDTQGLRGFSAWALGQEPTWLWRLLKNS
jgi:spore germination protein YaaH